MRAEVTAPGRGLGPRGGRDDGERRALPRDLRHHRPHAAGTSDDEQRLPRAAALMDAEPVMQPFPGGDGRQRHRCGFRKGQRLRLAPHDAFVDELQLRIAARAVHDPGVEDLLAGAEQRAGRAHRAHDARGIEAEDPRGVLRFLGPAALGVDRVHRDGAHLDEHVVPSGRGRRRDIEVEQRLRVVNLVAFREADGLHGILRVVTRI